MKMRIQERGFTLIEVMTVSGIIALLAVLALPNFRKARENAWQSTCIANLRQVQGAKQQWAVEHNKNDADVPTDGDLFGVGLYITTRPECPGGGTYDLGKVGGNITCTIRSPDHAIP